MALSVLRRTRWFRALLAGELLFALLVGGALWLLRQQALEGEARMLDLLARAMAQQADRTLAIGVTVLTTTQDELSGGLIAPAGAQTDALLRERARALPGFHALSLFDAAGHRLATSRPPGTPAPRDVGGLDFMEVARQAPQPGIYLSQPYAALDDGRPAVSLSMGWTDAQGRFAGVIVLVAEPGFLAGGFHRIADDKGVEQALFDAKGRPLPDGTAAGAGDADLPPAVVRQLAALPPLLDGPPRVVQGTAGRLLATATPLQELPLLQVVWRDVDEVLSGWRSLAWLLGALIVAMLAVSTGVGLRFAREQARVQGLEERLARSRKLEALGQLAGGVAHDFNNVLAAVVGYGEMARQAAPEGARQAHHLDQVLQAAERGRAQVERILAFSRGQPRRSVSFLLEPVVREVLEHLSPARAADVRLDLALHAPDAAVRGDPTATYEAVMNLCTNALQAMPGGGTLHLGLDEHTLAAPRQAYDTTLAPGPYLRLQVRDGGAGMSAEVLAHLFEPFFTTKGRHGGTGIGLAVVHGVVADLGGGIEVDSAPGRGTTFTLWLPRSAEPPEAAPAPDAPLPQGQGESVLVVDDEPALVALAEELLAELGYAPLGTTSSDEALQALREDPQRFDLLLTDEVMPGLAGTALARAARALRPDLPVIVASGHGGEDFEARAAEAGACRVLAKPLTRRALAQALHQALHPAPQPPA